MPESTLTPQQFVANWQYTELTESASAQSHFLDVSRMIGYELPHELDLKMSF